MSDVQQQIHFTGPTYVPAAPAIGTARATKVVPVALSAYPK
ncbi:MAG: hypothetical protein R3E44_02965 [Paracoccaceae bacterium]